MTSEEWTGFTWYDIAFGGGCCESDKGVLGSRKGETYFDQVSHC
jgi:hypothetical protein